MTDNQAFNPEEEFRGITREQEFHEQQEQKRLAFEAEQEQKRQKFEERLESQKARREYTSLLIAFVALIISVYAIVANHRDSIDLLHQSQRSYIGVGFNEKHMPVAKVVGATPARHVTIAEGDKAKLAGSPLNILDSEWPSDPNKAEEFDSRDAFFLPGTVVDLKVFSPKAPYFGVIYGTIFYDDVFGNHHHTHFCYQVEVRDEVFLCVTGNEEID